MLRRVLDAAARRLPGRAAEDEALVSALYRHFLGREPEAAEAAGWSAGLAAGHVSRANLVDEIAALPEVRRRRTGPLEATITALYRAILNRTPQPEELAAWTADLEGGKLAILDVVEAVASSPEAERRRTGDHAAAVQVLYRHLLGREAEPEEEAAWRQALADGALDLAELTKAIATSPEATARHLRPRPEWDLDAIRALVDRLYAVALARLPTTAERDGWVDNVTAGAASIADLVGAILTAPEASEHPAWLAMTPGRFIARAHEIIVGRSAFADEIASWSEVIDRAGGVPGPLAGGLLRARMEFDLPAVAVTDADAVRIMGTGEVLRAEDWRERAAAPGPGTPPAPVPSYPTIAIARRPEILVSAIASLYRGGAYIERFLDNMTGQTIFPEMAELIVVDAASPENEGETIARYAERFPNIVYHRAERRIGIYEAWNVGVRLARGRYLTNTNLDDLRRCDSFERQAEILEAFPFVDVVYQDFYYAFDPHVSFDAAAAAGARARLPIVTPYNLMRSNSPHNAPMWRRELHDEIGMFDESYVSAGDYELWLRAARAGKTFYKVNDPHVVYFVNPQGISTRPDSRGLDEARRALLAHGGALLSPRLLESADSFLAELAAASGDAFDTRRAAARDADWRYRAAHEALCALSAAAPRGGA